MLAGLVTDWYAPRNPALRWVGALAGPFFGGRGRSAFAARANGIPDELVHAFPLRSLVWRWQVRRLASRGQPYDAYVQTDAAFARTAARLDLPEHDVFFGYSYASLEAMEAEKRRGKLKVLDQIDPGPVHFRIVAEEMARHPELTGPPPEFPTVYYKRNRQEWKLADVIVVNSEWTREAIIAEGTDPAKIEVLPLAYEAAEGGEVKGQKSEAKPPISDLRPLNVLWLGQVNVPKGIHYLIEAARMLENEKARFDVVGAIGILPGAVASAPNKMTFHGPISRDRAGEWYQQADIFVLPTLSDGFAITQLEAMTYGLPVIVTPNCGRVVEDGKTGFIIPPRDPQALAEAILRFVRNPKLAAEISPRCIEVSRTFSIEAYANRLVKIIKNRAVQWKP